MDFWTDYLIASVFGKFSNQSITKQTNLQISNDPKNRTQKKMPQYVVVAWADDTQLHLVVRADDTQAAVQMVTGWTYAIGEEPVDHVETVRLLNDGPVSTVSALYEGEWLKTE